MTTPGASYFKDGAATDTDSDYEYMSNQATKENRSTIHRRSVNLGGVQQKDQDEESNSVCEESFHQDCSHRKKGGNDGSAKLISKPVEPASLKHEYQQSCENKKRNSISKEISNQDCSHKEKEENDGCMELIKETIETESKIHEHQQSNENEHCNMCEEISHQDCSHREKEDNDGFMKPIRGTMESASEYHGYQQSDENKKHKSIREESSRQNYSHRAKEDKDGYMKLIRETMEPTSQNHEYQKLNKETMDPPLSFFQTCNKKRFHTLWQSTKRVVFRLRIYIENGIRFHSALLLYNLITCSAEK